MAPLRGPGDGSIEGPGDDSFDLSFHGLTMESMDPRVKPEDDKICVPAA